MNINRLAQITIEDTYSRKNIRDHVMDAIYELAEDIEDKLNRAVDAISLYKSGDYYESKNVRIAHLNNLNLINIDIVAEILCIILPMKGPQTIQSICGRLGNKLGYEDMFDGIKTAAELITVVCESDLYDIIKPKASISGSAMVESNVQLPEELLQYIANTKYLPPMICEPRVIKSNWESGYLTVEDQIMLKNNTHDGKLPLDVINVRNSIALSIDLHMLQYEEESKNPLDTPEKIANFNRMKDSSRRVYNDLVEQGNKFYLTHKVDERLRTYTQGYHCSYQSSQYKKSLINLHKKELIV